MDLLALQGEYAVRHVTPSISVIQPVSGERYIYFSFSTHSMTNFLSSEQGLQPSISMNHHSPLERIEHVTTEIQQCRRRLLKLLHDRATASAACAKFEMALCDAAEMRNIMPSSPMGYLCRGDIYRLQGRQQAAISAYNKGLALSSTWSHDHGRIEELLQCNKEDAKHQWRKRIDFITQLPLDIVTSYIIPMLLGDKPLVVQEPCPYLYVSRGWRERIVLGQGGLKFHVRHLDDANNQLVRFAPYVGTLLIRGYQNNRKRCNALNGYPSLTRLGIERM